MVVEKYDVRPVIDRRGLMLVYKCATLCATLAALVWRHYNKCRTTLCRALVRLVYPAIRYIVAKHREVGCGFGCIDGKCLRFNVIHQILQLRGTTLCYATLNQSIV